jgi:transcriptional regulator with XRE-family HTH domain
MSTIKDLRKKHDLTQHQLADLTGIPFRTIQNWEGGQRKCPDYVEMLLVFYLEHTLNNDKEGIS